MNRHRGIPAFLDPSRNTSGNIKTDGSSPCLYHQAYGLTLASALPCPELPPAAGPAQVSISYGPVPEALEDIQQQGICYQVNAEAFLFKLHGVAKFLVTGGDRIIIERSPGARDNEVRLFLLGSVFAALLQQRGLLPLHGSAVAVDDGAAVFLGPSGSGKSTLAAALHQRGYRVIADDVCVISFSPAGVPFVMSGYPQLKLWADAINLIGKMPDTLMRVRAELDKYALPLQDGFVRQPLPLQRVYEIVVRTSPDFELTSVQGTDKLSILMNHTYRLQFLAGAATLQRNFAQCGQAARHCRVSRLSRPRQPLQLTVILELLEQDWT